jgi:VanZ family protein
MKSLLSFLRQSISPLLWTGLILLLSLLPPSNFPKVDILSFDKLIHVFLYTVLVFLTVLGLKKQNSFKFLRYHSNKVSIIYGLLFGIFTEYLQQAIAIGRDADWNDVIANSIGCGLGFICFFLVYGKENTYRVF